MLSAAHCFYDQGTRLDHKKMAIVAGSSDPTNQGILLKGVDNKTVKKHFRRLLTSFTVRAPL